MSDALLQVTDLSVMFATPDGPVHAVKNLEFSLTAGETLGIVGESGSGKSQTMLAIMGLLAENGCARGRAVFDGEQLLGLPASRLNRIRGARIAMVFQDPMSSLNPFVTIGRQMSAVLRLHRGLSRREALSESERMLDLVQITDARRRLGMYPHELSGGMRQRVMIATALSCRPALLIADEPTTALDVTVQAQILALLTELRRELGTSVILITHDLGVIAGTCDHVLVMQDGVAKEHGLVDAVFHAPRDPYTKALLAAVPRLDAPLTDQATRPDVADPLDKVLTVEDMKVHFGVPAERLLAPARILRAVDGVSLELRAGETLGIVGESGCGKSTLARAMLWLPPVIQAVTQGRVCLLGRELGALDRRALNAARKDMQIIFQDPYAALNPRMTVREIVAEPLQTHDAGLSRDEVLDRVAAVLTQVGLENEHLNRYPHEFSGGQCQRVGIARALILKPRLIICDEPVSALDVSIQAQIVGLLLDLQAQLGLSLIFIAHDLAVVRRISHRVMVMYLGKVVESADRRTLFEHPRHPYTRALINAVPVPDPRVEKARRRTVLTGDVPSPLDPPSGCAFRTRCAHATQRCAAQTPALEPLEASMVACHHAADI